MEKTAIIKSYIDSEKLVMVECVGEIQYAISENDLIELLEEYRNQSLPGNTVEEAEK